MYQNFQQYRKNDVVTANQGRLIVMLYDGLIKQIDLGSAELRKEKPQLDVAHNALTKAQEILNELQISLNLEQGDQVAQSLLSLYRFFTETLMQANIRKNPEKFADNPPTNRQSARCLGRNSDHPVRGPRAYCWRQYCRLVELRTSLGQRATVRALLVYSSLI